MMIKIFAISAVSAVTVLGRLGEQEMSMPVPKNEPGAVETITYKFEEETVNGEIVPKVSAEIDASRNHWFDGYSLDVSHFVKNTPVQVSTKVYLSDFLTGAGIVAATQLVPFDGRVIPLYMATWMLWNLVTKDAATAGANFMDYVTSLAGGAAGMYSILPWVQELVKSIEWASLTGKFYAPDASLLAVPYGVAFILGMSKLGHNVRTPRFLNWRDFPIVKFFMSMNERIANGLILTGGAMALFELARNGSYTQLATALVGGAIWSVAYNALHAMRGVSASHAEAFKKAEEIYEMAQKMADKPVQNITIEEVEESAETMDIVNNEEEVDVSDISE